MTIAWEVRALGDICEIARGGSPRPIQEFITNDPNGVSWIKISDATASGKYIYSTKEKITQAGVQRSRMVNEGDFILSNSMSFGRPYIMKTSGCIHDGWLVLSDKKHVFDQDYLYYFLGSDIAYRQFDSLAAGSTVRNLNIESAKKVKVPLPPIAEQKRIAAILDEAFAGIAAATANAEKNLANARELFTSSLNSTFRNIPVGWTTTTLGEVCDFQGGSQPPKSVFMKVSKDDSVRLIQIRDYKSDNHIVYIPKGMARRFCNASDVMIGRYGPPLFQILRGIEGAYNVALMKAVPNTKHITKDFLYYFLKNGDILKYIIDASSRAAGQIGLNKETLEPYPISFPSIEAQGHLVSKLISLESDTRSLVIIYEQKLQRLAELKQAILQQAFSGELAALPDAEMQEEAA